MTKIIVAFHKPYPHSNDPLFLNLHVGKKNSGKELEMSGDDSGDSISELNPSFCELTGLYWVWKNVDLNEPIGLSHYRRYFNFEPSLWQRFKKQKVVKTSQFDFDKLAVDHKAHIESILKDHDFVLAKATDLKESIKAHYLHSHISADWEVLERVLRERAPEFDLTFFEKKQTLHEFNMFLCSATHFKEYMKWLFEILFEVNRQISLSDHPYQKRVIGFLSERLLNLYVYHHQYRVKEVPVFFLD
jgi:hypothetical protein